VIEPLFIFLLSMGMSIAFQNFSTGSGAGDRILATATKKRVTK
jgi:hypothetical protein